MEKIFKDIYLTFTFIYYGTTMYFIWDTVEPVNHVLNLTNNITLDLKCPSYNSVVSFKGTIDEFRYLYNNMNAVLHDKNPLLNVNFKLTMTQKGLF